MKHRAPDVCSVRLSEFGDGGVLALGWGKDHSGIAAQVEETPTTALVGLDGQGVSYLGYSYFKGTILKLLVQQQAGELGKRRLLLTSFGEDDLDGSERALAEDNKLMLCLSGAGPKYEIRIVGAKGRGKTDASSLLQDTIDVLVRLGPSTTGQVADVLSITPQNAKNRFDRLVEQGIVLREKIDSPSGGKEWLNSLW